MIQNAQLIDQIVSSICEVIRDRAKSELNIKDEERLKSLAFVHLCVRTIMDLPDDEAFDLLCEGGNDFGIDAIHWIRESDGQLTIVIFQGKYKRNFDGRAEFPGDGIDKLILAAKTLFDTYSPLPPINPQLRVSVEEIRSIIHHDGSIPLVRIFACNNGLKWNASGSSAIERALLGDQVIWEHVNHDRLVGLIHEPEKINDNLKVSGTAIIEELPPNRVLIAKISVSEISALIERNGDKLLERNVRKFLGLRRNRVNSAIHDTLLSPDSKNFYFFNNGITMTCETFELSNLLTGNYSVKVKNLQIINGGQTCLTINQTLKENPGNVNPQNAFVLIRLYQLPVDNATLIKNITLATNSQNPVDLRDLVANDEIQRRIETEVEHHGLSYRRKKMEGSVKATDITSGVAAVAILSVWKRKPHQAKFYSREHFGKLYSEIFSNDLNGSQVIIATLIYRIPESLRRRQSEGYPIFIRYASYFIAMQMGKYLLNDMSIDISGLNHQNFEVAKYLVTTNGQYYFDQAMKDVAEALEIMHGDISSISYQQLSATFRRGELIDILNEMPLRERVRAN